MKILMTYHGKLDVNSGAAGSMIRIGTELQRRGIDVEYFTYDNLPKFSDKRIYHFSFPYYLNRYIKNKNFQIVDGCTGDTWLLGLLNKSKKIKIVIRSSGLEHMEFDSKLQNEKYTSLKSRLIWGCLNLHLVALSLKTADHIIALTTSEQEYIKRKFEVSDARISIFRHALPQYFRRLPKRSKIDGFKILYVGIWNERKGIFHLASALEKLVQSEYDFSVTLAGVKVEENSIRQSLSKALNQRTQIIVSIDHHKLPELYLNHSVFVFPSRYEGFGKVLTEAMASGIPIITTSAGIADELIEHHVHGIRIPYNDAVAIYNALVWSLNYAEKMETYGRRAKLEIEEIDFDSCYQQRIRIYEKLIKEN